MTAASNAVGDFTARQRDVLDAVLMLMVEQGPGGLTMAAVARRASCSKETLYKWFGDRDGLLDATVKRQASQVWANEPDTRPVDARALRDSLETFAANWLRVISSDTSVALNRIAIGSAAASDGRLGRLVLANGRFAIGARLKPLLESARDAGLLAFNDAETAFRTFLGLVGRDVQIRLLLGDGPELDAAGIAGDARRATDQFLALHGVAATPASAGS